MKNLIGSIFILLILGCTSCAYILRPQGMSHLYSGEYTGLDTLIETNGYYIKPVPDGDSYTALMFYTDGSVQFEIRFLYDSDEQYIEKVVSNPKTKKIGNSDWGGWGVYELLNDSVIEVTSSLWYDKVSRMESTTSKFKILDREHIQQIEGWYHNETPFVFKPYPNRIDSANWLLNRGWFWKKGAKKK